MKCRTEVNFGKRDDLVNPCKDLDLRLLFLRTEHVERTEEKIRETGEANLLQIHCQNPRGELTPSSATLN